MKTKDIMAVIAILGIILITAYSIFLSNTFYKYAGPSSLAVDSKNNVYVNFNTSLLKIDGDGVLLDEYSYEDLGVEGDVVTDIQAFAGNNLLISVSRPGRIFRCQLDKLPCKEIILNAISPSHTVKHYLDPARKKLYVSDAGSHRILVYDLKGNLIQNSEEGPTRVIFPNTIFISNNELIIIDTNNHRILALDPDNLDKKLWEASTKNTVGSIRRNWPTDVSIASDNRFWVINSNELLRNGDIILMDKSKKPHKRIGIDENWNPAKLVARNYDMLAVSYDHYEIISISNTGNNFTKFGGSKLLDVLKNGQLEYEKYNNWWDLWIWVSLAPLLVLVVIAVALDQNSIAKKYLDSNNV